MSVKKRVLQIAVFLVIMFLTFYALVQRPGTCRRVGRALRRMSPWYLIPSVGLAVFFVCAGRLYDLVSAPFHEVTEARPQGKLPDPLASSILSSGSSIPALPLPPPAGSRSSFTI